MCKKCELHTFGHVELNCYVNDINSNMKIVSYFVFILLAEQNSFIKTSTQHVTLPDGEFLWAIYYYAFHGKWNLHKDHWAIYHTTLCYLFSVLYFQFSKYSNLFHGEIMQFWKLWKRFQIKDQFPSECLNNNFEPGNIYKSGGFGGGIHTKCQNL